MMLAVCKAYITPKNECKFEIDSHDNGYVVDANNRLYVPRQSEIIIVGKNGDVQRWRSVEFVYDEINDAIFLRDIIEHKSTTGIGIIFLGII